jgi:WD40 repeat protein
LQALDTGSGETVCVEWSPDGEHIVAGYEDGVAKVWDVGGGDVVLTFAGHTDQVWDVTWSPDGKRIVSSDETGTVKVWDAENGTEVLSFKAPGTVLSVNWSPDGKHVIAAGSFTEPVIQRAWQSTGELMVHAEESCVSRELTPEERNQFGLPSR